MKPETVEYARRLEREVFNRAEMDDSLVADAFGTRTLELLEEGGYTSNPLLTWIETRPNVRIHGFGHSDDYTILDLYTTEFTTSSEPLTKSTLQKHLRHAQNFLSHLDSIQAAHDPKTDIHQACEGVRRILHPDRGALSRIRVFLLTNRPISARSLPQPEPHGQVPVEFHLWDLERLARQENAGDLGEPIDVHFDEPLKCLSPGTGSSHSVHLAVIPGRTLAELYDQHRTRLLQLNVRAFLQTRAKVNKSIQATALDSPEWFLAYNNGITATASEAEFTRDRSGTPTGIKSLSGFQIVNGGQTTATLHQAYRKHGSSLEDVNVQMKLTIVSPEDLSVVVPRISEYSNSQNRVSQADFHSNDKFHVEFERTSRSVWAPPQPGKLGQTRWFYIRMRGAYEAELDKHTTRATRKKFREENPKPQSYTRTDLAKYVNAWQGLPYLVSRGAEKNFVEFNDRINRTYPVVDSLYCQRVTALKILFSKVDQAAKSLNAGSNKSAVTAYTLALLAQSLERRIDLDAIWRLQQVPSDFDNLISFACEQVMNVLFDGYSHVTEKAKKEQTWDEVSKTRVAPSEDIEGLLLTDPLDINGGSFEDAQELFTDVSTSDWESVLEWGDSPSRLTPLERTNIDLARNQQEGSEQASVQGAIEALRRAIYVGFPEPA